MGGGGKRCSSPRDSSGAHHAERLFQSRGAAVAAGAAAEEGAADSGEA